MSGVRTTRSLFRCYNRKTCYRLIVCEMSANVKWVFMSEAGAFAPVCFAPPPGRAAVFSYIAVLSIKDFALFQVPSVIAGQSEETGRVDALPGVTALLI